MPEQNLVGDRPSRGRLTRRLRPLVRAAVLALIAVPALLVALVLVPATPASAHDFLVSSSPATNSTVTEPPTSVSLTFNDLVLDLTGDGSSSVVEVTGPDAATTHFETGCASILGRTVSAPIALGEAGTYRVSWQIVSADGHPVSNSYTFDYRPSAGAVAASGTPTAPSCGAVGADRVTALPAASQATGDGIDPVVIVAVAGGIVVAAAAAVIAILVVARRREPSEKKV